MTLKLKASDKALASSARNVWLVKLPHGTPYEALFDPVFWSHVARDLRPGDLIEVQPADGSYFAELYVRRAAALWAHVAELRRVAFEAAAQSEAEMPMPETDAFEVRLRGKAGWCVVRLADKEIVFQHGKGRGEAVRWLVDYLAQVGG